MNAKRTETRLRLTLREAITQGVGGLFRNFPAFLMIAALPTAIQMGVRVAKDEFVHLLPDVNQGPIVLVLLLLPWTIFAVAWLKHLLLGTPVGQLWLPQWRRQHWRFLFCWLIALIGPITILLWVESFFYSLWPEYSAYLSAASSALTLYIFCCAGLALSAIATGQDKGLLSTLLRSWQRSWSAAPLLVVVLFPSVWAILFLIDFVIDMVFRVPEAWALGIGPDIPIRSFGLNLALGLILSSCAYADRQLNDSRHADDEKLLATFD